MSEIAAGFPILRRFLDRGYCCSNEETASVDNEDVTASELGVGVEFTIVFSPRHGERARKKTWAGVESQWRFKCKEPVTTTDVSLRRVYLTVACTPTHASDSL